MQSMNYCSSMHMQSSYVCVCAHQLQYTLADLFNLYHPLDWSFKNGKRNISASLHVSNLHPNVNEAVLYDIFIRAGRVLSIRVCRDVLTGVSLGTAYVNFDTPTDAENALKTLNFEEVCQQPMRIQWSQRDPSLRRSGIMVTSL